MLTYQERLIARDRAYATGELIAAMHSFNGRWTARIKSAVVAAHRAGVLPAGFIEDHRIAEHELADWAAGKLKATKRVTV